MANATESLHFNALFLEYLRDFFYDNPDIKFTVESIMESMPTFYNHRDLIIAGTIVLLRQNKIIRIPQDSYVYWQASKVGIQAMRDEAENVRLNKEIDLFIKTEQKDQMKWERWPKRHWVIVAIGTAILGGLVAHFIH